MWKWISFVNLHKKVTGYLAHPWRVFRLPCGKLEAITGISVGWKAGRCQIRLNGEPGCAPGAHLCTSGKSVGWREISGVQLLFHFYGFPPPACPDSNLFPPYGKEQKSKRNSPWSMSVVKKSRYQDLKKLEKSNRYGVSPAGNAGLPGDGLTVYDRRRNPKNLSFERTTNPIPNQPVAKIFSLVGLNGANNTIDKRSHGNCADDKREWDQANSDDDDG